jgi:hypothetical protein
VQFLWSLLPGAREARNQVIIGFAWLAAVGLWVGVPHLRRSSQLHDLVHAIGHVGVGIALGFGAFMIGSLSDDVATFIFGVRGGMAFTVGEEGALALIQVIGEEGRAELERLEGAIDRANSEFLLRVSLLPPLAIAAAASQRDGIHWAWLAGSVGAALALIFQAARRRTELRENIAASDRIRLDAQHQRRKVQLDSREKLQADS